MGQLWDNFGKTFRQFCHNFETTLRQLWNDFGTSLRQPLETWRKLFDNLKTTFGLMWLIYFDDCWHCGLYMSKILIIIAFISNVNMIIIIILDFILIIINTLSKGEEEYQSHVESHHLYEDAQWQNILHYHVSPSDSDSEMEILRIKNLQITTTHPPPATISTFLCFCYNKMSFFLGILELRVNDNFI